PTNAGSYEVIGVVDELNYSGAVTNTLVVFTAAPVVLSVDLVEPADIIVSWNSVSNRTYRLQYKNDLNETEWVDLPPDIMATGPVTTVTNSVGSEPQRFFRLRTLP
ncbi:MAG TPA: MBG domain-containing protein, partial [Verrucomicrobiota bacterium]|nr:MBG domain-containing protein [Verrucomicrobiota bacterium]HNT15555.1 MBG domain-containing protein [Verrucomicrobiota bacterium]